VVKWGLVSYGQVRFGKVLIRRTKMNERYKLGKLSMDYFRKPKEQKEIQRVLNKISEKAKSFSGEPLLSGDYIVTSDWHLPAFSPEITNRMLQIASKFKIKNLAIVGDLLKMDAFSKFQTDDKDDAEAGIESTLQLIDILFKQFNRIDWCMGNHEDWFNKHQEYKLTLKQLFEYLLEKAGDKIKIYKKSYMVLNNIWRLTHPKAYSRNVPTTERELAHKYRQSIIGTHGHLVGLGFDKSGKEVVAQIGGMFDIDKQHYVKQTDTTHPNWTQGFAMVKNNSLYLFTLNPKQTDWEFWLSK